MVDITGILGAAAGESMVRRETRRVTDQDREEKRPKAVYPSQPLAPVQEVKEIEKLSKLPGSNREEEQAEQDQGVIPTPPDMMKQHQELTQQEDAEIQPVNPENEHSPYPPEGDVGQNVDRSA